MKIVLLLTSALLLAAHPSLLAQQATPAGKEAPPDPPLLGTAPAECQWTVTYTQRNPVKDADTPQGANLRKMRLYNNPTTLSKHVLKSAGKMAIFTEYEAGIKTEAWVIGGVIHELPYREGQSIKYEEKKKSDFSEITWVKADNFRGTVDLKGTKVHLYEVGDATPAPESPESSGSSPRQAPTPGKGPVQRAYIDATSRLPVAVDLGDTVLTYRYSGPPATFPTPDDRIKKLMQENAPTKPR